MVKPKLASGATIILKPPYVLSTLSFLTQIWMNIGARVILEMMAFGELSIDGTSSWHRIVGLPPIMQKSVSAMNTSS